MPPIKKIYDAVINGNRDKSIRFADLQRLLEYFDFKCSVRGDHFIYRRSDTPIINLQPDGNNAKPYQVRQVRKIMKDKGMEV